MGFAEDFEDLQIWQRSRVLTNAIYDAFEKNRDYDFRSQIQSAAVSVMNNIAEGFERRTKKDFAHFLDLSKGSSGEVRRVRRRGKARINTTLLKMLNGLIKPDAGSITMRGRVGALIALGAGFNPILTGRGEYLHQWLRARAHEKR